MMAAERIPAGVPLGRLLEGMALLLPGQDREVTGLALDSRAVMPGDLFLAVAGETRHGGEYAAQAVRAGAVAVVWEQGEGLPAVPTALSVAGHPDVPVIGVDRLALRAGVIADRFYGAPSAAVTVVGITGTNGKTSCSHFLAQALEGAGRPCGIMGTVGYGRPGQLEAASHTTPDALAVQRWLARFRDSGTETAVMEVSSHGLHQGRVAGVRFHAALFTNLSRDHLDYHGDMASYGEIKRRLFHWPGLECAVVNADDAFGREILATLPTDLEVIAYSLEEERQLPEYPEGLAWVRGHDLRLDPAGVELRVETPWGDGLLRSPVLGRYNAANLLGVLGVLGALGVPLGTALEQLGRVRTPPGRMERFGGNGRPLVVVDYAHTPDALEQTLGALREHCRGRLWCVFGAGGDRDRGKRPEMGEVAERLADRLVVTDDNPRGESPAAIVAEIMAGLGAPGQAQVEHDRARAIALAVSGARAGDVVLVAGKGHEDYQQVGDIRHPFSDRDEVLRLLQPGGSA